MSDHGRIEPPQIVEAFLGGDESAVAMVDGWIDVALRDGFLSLRSEWDDLRQEVRYRLLRNLRRGEFRGHSALRTYVHRITKNVCIDFSRKAYRRREKPAPEESAAAAGPRAEAGASAWIAKDLLAKILAGLSAQDRMMVEMVFCRNLSYAEMARTLGVPEGTVKSRVARCKEKMLKRRRQLMRTGKGAEP